MAKIKIFVDKLNLSCTEEEQLAADIDKDARVHALANGIAYPKRCGYHGAYGSWVVFPYGSHGVRDALVAAITKRQISYAYWR